MYDIDNEALSPQQAQELINKEKAKLQQEAVIKNEQQKRNDEVSRLAQDNAQDFSIGIGYDSQAKAEEMNKEARAVAEAQNKQARIQEAEMYNAPDRVQKSYMQKVGRNTGIAYFDNKKDLTLMDAFLAKHLGLNTSYIYHRIDISSDNTNTNMNLTHFAKSAKNNANIAKNLIDNALISYENEQKGKGSSVWEGAKRKMDRGTRGLLDWGVNDLNAYQQKFNRDTLEATYMSDNSKQITNYDKEEHKSYVGESFSTPLKQMAYLSTAFNKQANALRSNTAPLLNNGKVKGAYKEQLARDYNLISQAQEAMNALAHSKSKQERDEAASLLVDIKGALENYN